MFTPLFRVLAVALLCAGARADHFTFRDLGAVAMPHAACDDDLAFAAPTVRLGDEREIFVTTWNVENVTRVSGRFEQNGVIAPSKQYRHVPKSEGFRDLAPWKFAAKQNKIARAARLAGGHARALPHFVIAPEVESRDAADHLFNSGPLHGKYRTFLTPGNDSRGIDIAFAVRADLDVDVEVESHVHAKWDDVVEGVEARVFTRDLPVLIVRDGPTGRPRLILVGQHAKSLRDRAGGRDPRSRALRAAQFAATARILDQYRERFGADIPIILAGDFNTDVRRAPEVDPIKRGLTDAFDHLGVTERATHTYHPSDAEVIPSQLDAVMVSDSVKPFLRRALVLPEFDRRTGRLLGPPRTLEQRIEKYPSDHRAITVVIDGHLFRRHP